MIYKEEQYQRVESLLREGAVFAGDKGDGLFRGRHYPFILQDSDNNFYAPARDAIKEYFATNGIAWWGGNKPTAHPLSSQFACLNHLFPVRGDREAVLGIIQQVDETVVDVLPIPTDVAPHAYVAFEAVSDRDHLNELTSTRGSNCTSVDALVVGKRKDGSVVLFPIEWKYTESYDSDDKGAGSKGEIRKQRYESLIDNSKQLVSTDHSVYYFEPFYQLMRQTLWAEQMVLNRNNESIKADDFIHVHVIPKENKDLLYKMYRCSKQDMETTWRSCLSAQNKYRIISPRELLKPLDHERYGKLLEYLNYRYWKLLLEQEHT